MATIGQPSSLTVGLRQTEVLEKLSPAASTAGSSVMANATSGVSPKKRVKLEAVSPATDEIAVKRRRIQVLIFYFIKQLNVEIFIKVHVNLY